LVIVEEKSSDSTIKNAIKDLERKFISNSPHYHLALQWIVGIATSGNKIVFGQLCLESPRRPQAKFAVMAEFNLNTLQQRLACARAAINIGRWVSWVHSSGYVFVSKTSFWETMRGVRSDVTITPKQVLKVFHSFAWEHQSLSDDEAEECKRNIRSFYEQIATRDPRIKVGHESGRHDREDCGKIPYLEWATKVCDDDGELTLRLQPVGLARFPLDAKELRDALRCVVTALSALHAHGWVHLDIRWSNIVWCGENDWYLIDAEFARKFGALMPKNLVAFDKGAMNVDGSRMKADVAADMYLVGMLLCDDRSRRICVGDTHAEALRKALCGPEGERVACDVRTAEWVLKHEFFNLIKEE
jgi:hypothetical protein